MKTARPSIDARLCELVQSRSGGTVVQIVRAFETREEFRSLCKDLRTCARALEGWSTSEAPEAPDRAAEYAGLMCQLASEIRDLLSVQDGPGREHHS